MPPPRTTEQFVELAPEAILGVARDGTIAVVNARAEWLFGYRREELIGQPVERLLPGWLEQGEARARRKDGNEFSVELAVWRVDADDGELTVAIVREGAPAHSEALERFAGGTVHELGNLLGVILQYSSFVAEELEQGSQARRDAEEVHRAAERAAALTGELARFSRATTPQPESAQTEPPHAASSATGGAARTGHAGGETLLVVEDEEDVRAMAVRILEDAGYAVLAAGSCAEALDLCRESGDELDLLLTDVRMPGMTGLDLAERITALRPQLPVLFMSGYSPGALPKRSVGQGGDRRFVQKPFTREALLREVRAALGS